MLGYYMPTTLLKENWKETWESPYKRGQIIISSLLMLIIVYILPVFFNHIEKRKGIRLNDWLLTQIPPHNVSVLIFAVIWGMIVFIVIRAIYNPSIYIYYCWTLILVIIARLTCISLVPLA
ncbi:MAG: hypothetical protein JWP44_2162, partial [Mucilaginibacter sp.]|nr:hypothetical protein [Mucilaginibacter sp.]